MTKQQAYRLVGQIEVQNGLAGPGDSVVVSNDIIRGIARVFDISPDHNRLMVRQLIVTATNSETGKVKSRFGEVIEVPIDEIVRRPTEMLRKYLGEPLGTEEFERKIEEGQSYFNPSSRILWDRSAVQFLGRATMVYKDGIETKLPGEHVEERNALGIVRGITPSIFQPYFSEFFVEFFTGSRAWQMSRVSSGDVFPRPNYELLR